MKKIIAMLAALLLLGACAAHASPTTEPPLGSEAEHPALSAAPSEEPEISAARPAPAGEYSAYAIEKIREINDKIINREIVESSYFYYISDNEELLGNVVRYNDLTASLTGYSTMRAARILIVLFELEDENEEPFVLGSLGYLDFSEDVREKINRIAKLSLYENSGKLMQADPELAYLLESDGGGSYGLWFAYWHPLYIGMDNEDMKKLFLEYFELEKTLFSQLEEMMG